VLDVEKVEKSTRYLPSAYILGKAAILGMSNLKHLVIGN
jgi:hypothetical protein